MKRYDIDGGIPTLAVALSEHMNADELKVLATLTNTSAPTRKAELVDHLLTYLEGDRLRTVWQCLDDLQKAAVAEVVHSTDTTFPAERFYAKYGKVPDFGSVSRWPRDQHPTALRFFFYAASSRSTTTTSRPIASTDADGFGSCRAAVRWSPDARPGPAPQWGAACGPRTSRAGRHSSRSTPAGFGWVRRHAGAQDP